MCGFVKFKLIFDQLYDCITYFKITMFFFLVLLKLYFDYFTQIFNNSSGNVNHKNLFKLYKTIVAEYKTKQFCNFLAKA